ncbi:1-phosphofructokinase family hexose kinase [Cellulomonas telluris]|uniref:1-phosphofructokinase family hexose kinase n=1 Tax=Cellulomonas telluris TaxID=2306636 RepID=UPI0010A8E62E|nr:PfkB family carbohydrate kinase [Cellulomonas telluris]
MPEPTDSTPAQDTPTHPTDDPTPTRRPAAERVCVMATTPWLTVTVEAPTTHVVTVDGDEQPAPPEVHVHPGGQGLWVARMAESLGADAVVCGPFGGEAGIALRALAEAEGMELRAVPYGGGNGVYVHDRRDGERDVVAERPAAPLDRHELDDLYGTVLVEGLEADVTVLTGADPAHVLPPEVLTRLVRDLRAAGRTLVADLSGDAARAYAEAGGGVLKISHEEMAEGGFADGEDVPALVRGARGLLDAAEDDGLDAVVVSRAGEGVLVVTREGVHEVRAPQTTVADHRGAGDSMTAGIAVGLARGLDLVAAVRLGASAGALNVTRRGLGTGHRDHIERFVDRVEVRDLGTDGSASDDA